MKLFHNESRWFVVDHPAVKGQYFLKNCTFVPIKKRKKTWTTFCLSVLLCILFLTGTITSTGSEQPSDSSLWRFIGKRYLQCSFCGIGFPDQTLYFLHKGCHSDANPWKCNICGEQCCNVYEFNSHLLSKSHQWQWMFNSKPKRGFGSIAEYQTNVCIYSNFILNFRFCSCFCTERFCVVLWQIF